MADNLKDLEGMQAVVKEFRTISKSSREVLLRMLGKEHEEIGDRVDSPLSELKREYLAAGGRINDSNKFISSIKRVREITGMGLRESKELVESW